MERETLLKNYLLSLSKGKNQMINVNETLKNLPKDLLSVIGGNTVKKKEGKRESSLEKIDKKKTVSMRRKSERN